MRTRIELEDTKTQSKSARRNPLICKQYRNKFCLQLSSHILASLAETIIHFIQGRLLRPICCRNQLNGYVITVLFCVFLSACSSSPVVEQAPPNSETDRPSFQRMGNQVRASLPRTAQALSAEVDDAQVIQAQANQAHKVEVLFSARVKKLLPDDTKGLPHQRFLLELSNGSTVLIAHDTKYAPSVPIQAGDLVTVKGEYIWNKRGGVVHWTHRSDTPRHEGGFIDFQGTKYQ
jgi:hypothetical protein